MKRKRNDSSRSSQAYIVRLQESAHASESALNNLLKRLDELVRRSESAVPITEIESLIRLHGSNGSAEITRSRTGLHEDPLILYQHVFSTDLQHGIKTDRKTWIIERCRTFLSTVQTMSRWHESRTASGLTTLGHNRWMIRCLIEDPSLEDDDPSQWRPIQTTGSPAANEEGDDELRLPTDDEGADEPRSSNVNELARAGSYARRTAKFRLDQKVIDKVCWLRDLVFIDWCTVMVKRNRCTNDDVQKTMCKRFKLSASTSSRKYQYGANWVSTASSILCTRGWGKRAFELFCIRK